MQVQDKAKRWSDYSSSASEESPEEGVLEAMAPQRLASWPKKRLRRRKARAASHRRSRCDWTKLLQALSYIATESPTAFAPSLRSRMENIEATFDFAGTCKEDFTPVQCQLLVNVFHDFFPRGLRVCHWKNMKKTVLFQPYRMPSLYVKTYELLPAIVIVHKYWEAGLVVWREGFYVKKTIRSLMSRASAGAKNVQAT